MTRDSTAPFAPPYDDPIVHDPLRQADNTFEFIDGLGMPPEPSIVVRVKHRRIRSEYRLRTCLTSYYRVLGVDDLTDSLTEQREQIQSLIQIELDHGNPVKLLTDTTSAGLDLALEWAQALSGGVVFHGSTVVVPGEGRKLGKRSVSDLIGTTVRAFQDGRVGIPKSKDFGIRKLTHQFQTQTLVRGNLKPLKLQLDDSTAGIEAALALSLVVGQCETAGLVWN